LDEAPIVHGIMLQAFAEYAGALPVESSALVESVGDVETAMHQGGAILAFVDAEDAVGSARFKLEPDGLYVGRVAVLPTHRRLGIGSAMMRFLEHVAMVHARDTITIQVRDSLPSNVGLYRSLGYRVTRIDPHPRGPDRVWTMKRCLITT
jgi:ribosomal protein S18 acetylase RimI-like enzyme